MEDDLCCWLPDLLEVAKDKKWRAGGSTIDEKKKNLSISPAYGVHIGFSGDIIVLHYNGGGPELAEISWQVGRHWF